MNLEAAEARARSVVLSFVEADDGLGRPALYDVRYAEGSMAGDWEGAMRVTEGTCAPPLEGREIGSVLTCTVRGLEPATTYEFRVAAYRQDPGSAPVYGEPSDPAPVTTAARDEDGELALVPADHRFTALDAELVLAVEAYDHEGQPIPGPEVTWSTSDESVATVDEEGRVTARGVGMATIAVAGVCCAAGEARIEVEQVVVAVAVTPGEAELEPGGSVVLEAEAEDAEGNEAPASFEWSSSDTDVATVGAGGRVTAVAPGSSTIVATAGDAEGSAEIVVVAAPEPPAPEPPPAGSNEPAGYVAVTERSFDDLAEAGWRVDGGSNFSISNDNAAPRSCCSVGQARYPRGFQGGTGPVRTWRSLGGADTGLYMSFWMKLSDNFQGHTSGVNKIFFVWIHDNPSVVLSATGRGSGGLRPQFRLQNIPTGPVNLSANVNNVSIQRGKWHHWEAQIVSNTGGLANGVARVWMDGVLVMDHRNVTYASSSQARTWQTLYWNPTWGGVGDVVAQDMYMWMDHLYVSGTR